MFKGLAIALTALVVVLWGAFGSVVGAEETPRTEAAAPSLSQQIDPAIGTLADRGTDGITTTVPADPSGNGVSTHRTQSDLIPWASGAVDEPAIRSVPASIEIPAIGVTAPILDVGVEATTGQMEVVDNATTVGWYRFGPLPGEAGSAVLAAHVDLAGAGPGVFFDLHRLEEGDQLTIVFDDGSRDAFVVVDNNRVAKDDLHLDEIFRRTGQPVVRLVTCGGAFNRTARSYSDNVVVTLIPRMAES